MAHSLSDMAAPVPLEPCWRQELVDRGFPDAVLAFFQQEAITTPARFANYINTRDEIMPVVVSKLPHVPNPQALKGMLTELWREVDHAESLRLQRKASGLKEDDLEDPLCGSASSKGTALV